MKDNISPEEKLLNLIKGDKKTAPKLPVFLHRQPVKKNTAAASAVKTGLRDQAWPIFRKYFTAKYVHVLIVVFFVLSLVNLFFAFIYPWIGLQRISLPDVPKGDAQIAMPETGLKQDVKPYEFYAQALSRRQIFSDSNLSAQGQSGISSVAPADLIKDLNLVGIISGEHPQAVIEDRKTQKTYYLNEGQYIGQLQIDGIQQGKIILKYNNQKYELYL